MPSNILIYGANGYTGELIVQIAAAEGAKPILAGRSPEKIRPLAEKHGMEHRAFSLDAAAAVDKGLAGIGVVLHCAGPFSRTASQMAEGCMRAKAHYLDITGEIEVFERMASMTQRAAAQGVMLMPGTGFDVVPSDCLAAHLKRRMPDATELTLAFQAIGRPSRGTATTMIENIHRGGMVRRAGTLTPIPAAAMFREIDFGSGAVNTMSIPWGDVATAFYSTGIPNIQVFMATPPQMQTMAKLSRRFGWLIGSGPVQGLLKRQIQAGPAGPNELERRAGKSELWGEVKNASGSTSILVCRRPKDTPSPRERRGRSQALARRRGAARLPHAIAGIRRGLYPRVRRRETRRFGVNALRDSSSGSLRNFPMTRISHFVSIPFAIILAGLAPFAQADELHLLDGSLIYGTITLVKDGAVTIKTGFAGDLKIPLDKVKGLSTDADRSVTLKGGGAAAGQLQFVDGQQKVLHKDSQQAIEPVSILEIAPLTVEGKAPAANWTGRAELGLKGESGNVDRFDVNALVSSLRATPFDRLTLSLRGQYEESNDDRTKNEVLGLLRYERDFSPRMFAFTRLELEYDEFENLDLRTTLGAGLGYFFMRQPRQDLKGRAGFAYEHEEFSDGSSDDAPLLELGYDYRLNIRTWLRFNSTLAYFLDPRDVDDWRLDHENSAEVPLSNTSGWKLRFGIRNEYDADPQPDVDYLDTSYYTSLVYTWD